MQAAWLMVVLSTVGVDVGWQPLVGGGFEYIIQIEPETLESLKAGQDITSYIPPDLRGVRQYRITVGRGPVPRLGNPPAVPAETPGQTATQLNSPATNRTLTTNPSAGNSGTNSVPNSGVPNSVLLGNRGMTSSGSAAGSSPSNGAASSGSNLGNSGTSLGAGSIPSNPPVNSSPSPRYGSSLSAGNSGTGNSNGTRSMLSNTPENAGSGLRYAEDETRTPGSNPSNNGGTSAGSGYSGMYDSPASSNSAAGNSSSSPSSSPSNFDRYQDRYNPQPAGQNETGNPPVNTNPSGNPDDRWATPPNSNRQTSNDNPGPKSDPFALPSSEDIAEGNVQQPSNTATNSSAGAAANETNSKWDRYANDGTSRGVGSGMGSGIGNGTGSWNHDNRATAEPAKLGNSLAEKAKPTEPKKTEDGSTPRPFLTDGVAERLVAYHADSEEEGEAGAKSESEAEPAKSWWLLTFTALLLFVSMGGNAYLGWLSWGLYHQCLRVLDRFRASRRVRLLG